MQGSKYVRRFVGKRMCKKNHIPVGYMQIAFVAYAKKCVLYMLWKSHSLHCLQREYSMTLHDERT